MNARVDKQWKEKGLKGYSTEAILGTLGHYGAPYDEASFKAAAGSKYPLELAMEWERSWKGTGQFVQFPFAAVNELYTRLLPDTLTPQGIAVGLMEAMTRSLKVVQGGETAELDEAFGKAEAQVGRLPEKGERRDVFLGELATYLEPVARNFNELPIVLAQSGKKEQALRFAKLHESIFVDREGTVTAVVNASTGDRDGAVSDLTARAADANREIYARYYALDALAQLQAYPELVKVGLGVFDAAADQKKWQLADTIAHMLAQLTQRHETNAQFIQDVNARLNRAHAATGGHSH